MDLTVQTTQLIGLLRNSSKVWKSQLISLKCLFLLKVRKGETINSIHYSRAKNVFTNNNPFGISMIFQVKLWQTNCCEFIWKMVKRPRNKPTALQIKRQTAVLRDRRRRQRVERDGSTRGRDICVFSKFHSVRVHLFHLFNKLEESICRAKTTFTVYPFSLCSVAYTAKFMTFSTLSSPPPSFYFPTN